ncbi:MAG: hypothetical protein HC915_07855 [Anaerolineae bacterium]|nr:hypothetical protein [Anaerolineae bacterium]
MIINSTQNAKLKQVRALLQQTKTRARERQAVLEGVRLVQDVIGQGYVPEFILHRADFPLDAL